MAIYLRIGLFDLCYCLASHSGERLNLSFQRERLGPESPVLQRVPIADGSPGGPPRASGTPYSPARPALGTVARSFSIERGISMPGA